MISEPPPFRAFREFEAVPRIEVKRCYAAAQFFKRIDQTNTRYLRELTREEFVERLRRSKKYVHHLSEPELDRLILGEKYPKRLKMYNSCNWYTGAVSADEVGVWKGAGGLAPDWTYGALSETAILVREAIQSDDKKLPARAKRSIPRIVPHIDLIEKDPYLYPIIAPGATMGRGLGGRPYKHFQLMKGDIEDGCMRSIALVVSGRTIFSGYVGVRQIQ